MSEILNEARRLRPYIEIASASLSDLDALNAVELFPQWKADTAYIVGTRVQHENVLYKCQQAHTSQQIYTPDMIPALWVVVSAEDGTVDKPITAVRGMEYEEGKYYLDTEDGNVYLCTRTAVLQYLPHELIGHYFEVV